MKNNLDEMSTDELMEVLVKRMKKDYNNSKKETEIQNYITEFDKTFETDIKSKINETPLLTSLFNDFVQEIYKPSETYLNIQKTKIKLKEQLIKDFTEEQRNLFKQINLCEDRILEDMTEQAFIYGYSMSSQLREESTKKYTYKQK